MKKNRIKYFTIILIMMFLTLALRLAFLQLINGDYYSQQAEAVFSRVYSEKPQRGEILTTEGIKLATNIQSFNIIYTDNRKVVPEKDIPKVLLKAIRVLKNETPDYEKLILDTLPIKIDNNKVEFDFDVYVSEEDLNLNDNISQEEKLKKIEEKRQKILKAKEERFKKDYNLPLDLDANQTLYELFVKYKIANKNEDRYIFVENMSLQEAKDVLSLRLLIEKNRFYKYKPVEIAKNVSRKTAFYIAMKSEELPNVSFNEEPLRYYPNGDFASHILGYLSRAGEDTAEQYKSLGYDINNEWIGAIGLEAKFENITKNEYGASLRGEPKEKYITVDKFGNQLKLIGEVEGIPGDTIVTTISYNLQKVAEESLERLFKNLQEGKVDGTRRPNANRGAVVVANVKTGEILALVSKPSFDPNLFAEFGTIKDEETRLRIFTPEKFLTETQKYYNEVLKLDIVPKPLYNYATKSLVPPGSTFKLLTSIAALEEGIITPNTIIVDKGMYRELPGFKGNCWIWNEKHTTHGPVNVAKALQVSCNYFYYAVAQKMGWDKFDKWVKKYNLIRNGNNSATGIEIGENFGQASSVEKRKALFIRKYLKNIMEKLKIKEDDKLLSDIKEMFLNENLDDTRLAGLSENQKKYINSAYNQFIAEAKRLSDLLSASIGQGENQFTPLQLAQFYMTVVNGGNRYKLHLVKEILNPDGSLKYKVEPEVLDKVEIKPETYNAVMQGLQKVNEEGSAASVFRNYPIPTGGKTGTVQIFNDFSSEIAKRASADGVVANGVYVGVAPINDPQIVVVVLVYNAGHGYSCASVVKDIYDEYFGLNKMQPNSETSNSQISTTH
ncbi:penicillin-binding transpeptidase domain-containing protein [Caloramator sp. ALD01]|uniref:penicillin-binding transpeptidase domain-containing protein n=1 Tax=Caloramator sp. ALD01 TaxID=1031288 RepID=UPI00041C96C4|nr:penicillin-binding transpeptidase domain-containing protein [Caloramator sp. ALD01]